MIFGDENNYDILFIMCRFLEKGNLLGVRCKRRIFEDLNSLFLR